MFISIYYTCSLSNTIYRDIYTCIYNAFRKNSDLPTFPHFVMLLFFSFFILFFFFFNLCAISIYMLGAQQNQFLYLYIYICNHGICSELYCFSDKQRSLKETAVSGLICFNRRTVSSSGSVHPVS